MINNKNEYKMYLNEDMRALGIEKFTLRRYLLDPIWKFQRLMRKLEYYNNCKGTIFKPVFYFLKHRYKKMSIKLGFSIPINTFGYGLCIVHYGTIIINPRSKIGNNCRIHCCVNIGGHANDVPQLGDNCYIGPGAKLFGNIKIGDNTKIGANSVVNKSFEEGNTTIVGVPARKVNR